MGPSAEILHGNDLAGCITACLQLIELFGRWFGWVQSIQNVSRQKQDGCSQLLHNLPSLLDPPPATT